MDHRPGKKEIAMLNIEKILTRLTLVKKTGDGRYLARCPAHEDRSPSLSIKEADDKILIRCFAGCDIESVLAALGLDFSDLFPPRPTHTRHQRHFKLELFPLLIQEALVCSIAAKDAIDGKLNASDLKRVNQAIETIFRIKREVNS